MILLIDNYDSFVHNLARYFRRLGHETLVVRNDVLDLAAVDRDPPAALVLSPGPATPDEAGASLAAVRRCLGRIPILGICLGHQTLAAARGARIIRAPRPVHGQTSLIHHDGRGLFQSFPGPFRAARYHSLVIDPDSLPSEFEVTARTDEEIIMAIRHRTACAVGLQFHPESILTDLGYPLLAGFLREAGLPYPDPLPGGEIVETVPTPRPRAVPPHPVTF